MGKGEKKYRREQKAKHCLQQQVFSFNEESVVLKENPSKFAKIEEKGVDPGKRVTCPWCLGFSKLRLWLISTNKGYDRGKGKCPLCGQGARFDTLLKVMSSPEQYAVFAYTYPARNFWEKIKKVGFKEWNKWLEVMGWTQRFWDEYKNQRGDKEREAEENQFKIESEEYEKMMNNPERRKQEDEEFRKSQEQNYSYNLQELKGEN